MQLTSLARLSDLIFARSEGQIEDHGDYISIKTPNNPSYHWGNYLIFDRPPLAADCERWREIYSREFDYYQQIKHMTFTWQGPAPQESDLMPFLAAGFKLERGKAFLGQELKLPPRPQLESEFRILSSDSDWEQAIQLQSLCRNPAFEFENYLEFKRRQFATYRKLAEQDLGAWFGLFDQQQLLADLGIFHAGQQLDSKTLAQLEGLGRFQSVETHPEYRRKGLCSHLVYTAANYARQHWQLEQLVIEADADYHAATLYESLGFKPMEDNYSLSWWI